MSAQPPDPKSCPTPPPNPPAVQNLVGLAFSGGGIRSASFNLGVLQGLDARNVLWIFDYLSTVSGGGFIGAWWSAWLSRVERKPPGIFPKQEELEPGRRALTAVLLRHDDSSSGTPGGPDGSRIARREDPIHFLRLFSNYLTPKSGALSPDTWRLVAFFIRNLLFTWVILLPVLLAVVMAGQAYFLASDRAATAFLCTANDVRSQSLRLTSAAVVPNEARQSGDGFCATPVDLTARASYKTDDSSRVIRWKHIAKLMILLFAAYATLAILWLAYASIPVWLALLSLAGVTALVWTLIPHQTGSDAEYGNLLTVVAIVLGGHTLQALLMRKRNRPAVSGAGVEYATASDYRSLLGKQQAWLLRFSTLVGFLLIVAAFGHDFVDFLIQQAATSWRARAGWGGVLLAVISGVYTITKALPTTQEKTTRAPGKIGAALIAIAPSLALVVVALGFAALSHRLLQFSASLSPEARLRSLALVAGCMAVVQVVFALFETFQDPESPPTAATFWQRFVPQRMASWLAKEERPKGWIYLFSPRGWVRVSLVMALLVLWLAASGGLAALMMSAVVSLTAGTLAVATLVAALLATLAPNKWRIALGSARSAALLSITAATATFTLLATEPASASAGIFLVAPLWIVTLIGFVICSGWLADPNLLSLHGFYKGRLSRAYLGASNTARKNLEITDAAAGDDIKLTGLWNHDGGGPYHLINTTLSLVGGSDLAMSQRSAENFVMSRYHCGSARAGYRCTAEYMSGRLSLATAVAVSGAAISPNMGSKSPSAALALFLSLFNVRLGFWAPTPSGRRWREPHARLWPFYVLRETLSNTGQIGTYCYLTDGGHFDNTGLYALIERGCRYIVLCDCGADPSLKFNDIGIAIRRCRIDFGTEIDLRIDQFAARRRRDRTTKTHVVMGKIRYQDEHLRMLGLDPTRNTGVIVWIKPTVTALNSADIRQYHRENVDFPQQSTRDQWYDESQFESYRKLGFESALEAFKDLGPPAPLVQGNFASIEPWFQARV